MSKTDTARKTRRRENKMKFKTIAEAFNYYRNATLEEIERRAAEIKGTIETDAEADITTLNIELSLIHI